MNSSMLNFLKLNSRWFIAGISLVILGYMILGFGRAGTATVFAWQKLTLAPVILFLGYLCIGVSVMIRSKK